MSQQSLIASEPYVIAFAVYTLRGDAWGLAPDEPGPAGWAAIVRRAGNRAAYATHCCHATRAAVTEAGLAHMQSTFGVARDPRNPIDLVWIVDEAGATTEQQRVDLRAARELARRYTLTPHEPVVQVEMAGADR